MLFYNLELRCLDLFKSFILYYGGVVFIIIVYKFNKIFWGDYIIFTMVLNVEYWIKWYLNR